MSLSVLYRSMVNLAIMLERELGRTDAEKLRFAWLEEIGFSGRCNSGKGRFVRRRRLADPEATLAEA